MSDSSGEQFHEFINGLIHLVVGALDGNVGSVVGCGPMLEHAGGNGAVDALAQLEHEDGLWVAGDADLITIGVGHSLDQAVGAQFAQVVAQLVEGVAAGLQPEGFQNLPVQLAGRPAAQMAAKAAHDDFQHPHDADLIEPDAGDARLAHGERAGQFGQQVEVAVDVQGLRLDPGKAIHDAREPFPHGLPVGQGLVELEVLLQFVADHLQAQEAAGLLVLFDKAMAPVAAHHVPRGVEALHDGRELAGHPPQLELAEDVRQPVHGQRAQGEFATAPEEIPNRKRAVEDEVQAVFHLAHTPEPVQLAGGAFLFGELRTDNQRPVIQAPLNGGSIKRVGGGLQSPDIADLQEGVVLLAMADGLPAELPLDEVVPVEIGRRRKGQEGAEAQDHGAGHLVEDVEVVVSEASAMAAHHRVVRIGGRVAQMGDAISRALLHALEDVVNAKLAPALPAPQRGLHEILLADIRRRPLHRDELMPRVSFHPVLILPRALQEDLGGDLRHTADFAKEEDDVLLPHEKPEVTLDHHPVETSVRPLHPMPEKSEKQLHMRASSSCWRHRNRSQNPRHLSTRQNFKYLWLGVLAYPPNLWV